MLHRHQTLSPLGSQLVFDGSNVYVIGNNVPIFWIGEETANRILAGTGEEVGELRRRDAALGQDEVFTVETGRRVSLALEATPRTGLEAVNVIGQLPGESAELDSQMIVVLAQYDAPPLGPGSAVYPNANDNASGVGLMLEIIRTMRDSGYRPEQDFPFRRLLRRRLGPGQPGPGRRGALPVGAAGLRQRLHRRGDCRAARRRGGQRRGVR